MVELFSPRSSLSAAIKEFAGKASLPKGVVRKAAAVFFKTEEFERRLGSLREERGELGELHAQELELLPEMTQPMLGAMKTEHARREGKIKATHELLSQMEASYGSAHRKLNDFLLDEVSSEDKFVEQKAELMLAAPQEYRKEAMGEIRKDDKSLSADYVAKFEGLLDEWKKSFSDLDGKYAGLRSQYPPEKPLAEMAAEEKPAQAAPPKPVTAEMAKPRLNVEVPKPAELAKPAEMPKPAEPVALKAEVPQKPAEIPKPAEITPRAPVEIPKPAAAPAKKYRDDAEAAAERIMHSYSLPDSEHDMLCELFTRLAGNGDAQGQFLRVESLYETADSLLKQMKMDAPENLRAVAANLGKKWEKTEGEWRAKSMEAISLLADAGDADKPLLLGLLKDPEVTASSLLYWFELHYAGMEPRELDAAIAEDKMKHPGAAKMIDGFHSLMAGFDRRKGRLIAVKMDLPHDAEIVLVFEIEKVENELGGFDYYILSTPSSADTEARFEGRGFDRLLSTPGMHGYGHSHTSGEREEFTASDLAVLIKNPSIPHILMNAETGSAQLYNPRTGLIVKLETMEL